MSVFQDNELTSGTCPGNRLTNIIQPRNKKEQINTTPWINPKMILLSDSPEKEKRRYLVYDSMYIKICMINIKCY